MGVAELGRLGMEKGERIVGASRVAPYTKSDISSTNAGCDHALISHMHNTSMIWVIPRIEPPMDGKPDSYILHFGGALVVCAIHRITYGGLPIYRSPLHHPLSC